MANIKPFRGYIFNQQKISDLGAVMAPPYDAITDEEREMLYNRHDYNAIRLTRGMQHDTDNDENNRFTRARDFLSEWIEQEILKRDPESAIYMYEQVIEYNGSTFSTRGFVSLLELEEVGKNVIPCEDTTPVNKADRYNLLSETKANFNMISCMFIEPEQGLTRLMTEISDTVPALSFSIEDGSKEKLWKITDPGKINYIVETLKPHTLYIVDGQNRYETSLKYQATCKENNPNHTGKEPYNYIMTLLTSSYDDGIVQLPYHRLVKSKKPFNESYFVSACQDNFLVEKIIVDSDTSNFIETIKKQIAVPRDRQKLAVYCGGEYFYRLILKDDAPLRTILPEKSNAYRMLDVTVLNKLVLEDILMIPEENYDERIEYTKSVSEGISKVDNGEFVCLIAVNPVKTEQIRAVAMAHERMPSHSICVFPKPVTGVLFNILED